MASLRFSFVTAARPIDWLIRHYDRGPWSHVDHVTPESGLRVGAQGAFPLLAHMPASAYPMGVQMRPAHYRSWTAEKLVDVVCTGDQELMFTEFLRQQIGKPYDYRDLLPNFYFGRDWGSTSTWYCAELQVAGLVAAGVLDARPLEAIRHATPNSMYRELAFAQAGIAFGVAA